MTSLSRPAQASLAFQPVGLLNRPRRPLSRGFDPASYPTEPLVNYQVLPTTSWVILPPLVNRAVGRTERSRLGSIGSALGSRNAKTSPPAVVSLSGARTARDARPAVTTRRPASGAYSGFLQARLQRPYVVRRPQPCPLAACWHSVGIGLLRSMRLVRMFLPRNRRVKCLDGYNDALPCPDPELMVFKVTFQCVR